MISTTEITLNQKYKQIMNLNMVDNISDISKKFNISNVTNLQASLDNICNTENQLFNNIILSNLNTTQLYIKNNLTVNNINTTNLSTCYINVNNGIYNNVNIDSLNGIQLNMSKILNTNSISSSSLIINSNVNDNNTN